MDIALLFGLVVIAAIIMIALLARSREISSEPTALLETPPSGQIDFRGSNIAQSSRPIPGFAGDDDEAWMDAKVEQLSAKGCIDAQWFHSRVVGVSYANEDGSSRQRILAGLDMRIELKLQHDPDNPYDSNCVTLLAPGGKVIGHLNRRLAGETVRAMKRGEKRRVFVLHVDGGGRGQNFGCHIAVLRWTPADEM